MSQTDVITVFFSDPANRGRGIGRTPRVAIMHGCRAGFKRAVALMRARGALVTRTSEAP